MNWIVLKMKKSLKYITLITIALLSCSTSWCQTNKDASSSLTGGVQVNDTVCIPIELLRVANAKMVELDYEKQINQNLREIVYNDSIVIDDLRNTIEHNETVYSVNLNKVETQRNIAIGTSAVLLVLFIISLL